jgi:predicted CXXCH cytochrome family protein
VFCHTPHSSDVDLKPLWNRHLSAQIYSVYGSTTFNGGAQQPGERSKLCLGCHDGTVALGQTVANDLIPTRGSMSPRSLLGTDLRNDHPIGFELVDDGQLVSTLFQSPPSTRDPAVKLVAGRVECTTCHEPHMYNIDAVAGAFLVRSNTQSMLCLSCHDPSRGQPNQLNGWPTAAHATATNTAPGDGSAGIYGAVAANACLSCHLPHNAPDGSPARLLRAPEESVCLNCHAGSGVSPALANILNEVTKIYSHPTLLVGLHDAAENAFPLNGNRHAECEDCHNPHAAAAETGSTNPPALTAPQRAVSGVDVATGATALRPASNQYEVCFKCHANSTEKPQATAGYSAYGRTPRRLTDAATADPFNTRLEFNSAFSRHPVTQPRRLASTDVPSLRPAMLRFDGSQGRALSVGTYIYCSDCHSNDAAVVSGGTGPNGPHGSIWPHLLERRYDLEPAPATPGSGGGTTYVPGLTGSAALCQKCHDVDGNILLNRSFNGHSSHVVGRRASCSTCHESHGIAGGNATNNPSMVNFDTTIIGPNISGQLRIERTGTFHGRCYLRCHGSDHNGNSY